MEQVISNICNINNLPVLMWAKDLNYRYVASSNRLIKVLGCPSETSLYEHDDFNQPWAEFAQIYRDEDDQVLAGKSLAFVHPLRLFTGENLLGISRKIPFYNHQNKIIGILGSETIISAPKILKKISRLQQSDFEINAIQSHEFYRYQVSEYFPGSMLSKRESACLFYIIRGKTAKEIADIFHISKRTVEKHITNIKDKFNCKTKSEMIDKAVQLGFVNFIPGWFLNTL